VDLSRNDIPAIDPGHMQDLTDLEHLNLGFNRIACMRGIGPALAGGAALRWLVLKRNSLRSTAGLEALLSLEGLDLSGNLLSTPEDVVNVTTLPRLRAVWFEDNPLASVTGYRVKTLAAWGEEPGCVDIVLDGRPASKFELFALHHYRHAMRWKLKYNVGSGVEGGGGVEGDGEGRREDGERGANAGWVGAIKGSRTAGLMAEEPRSPPTTDVESPPLPPSSPPPFIARRAAAAMALGSSSTLCPARAAITPVPLLLPRPLQPAVISPEEEAMHAAVFSGFNTFWHGIAAAPSLTGGRNSSPSMGGLSSSTPLAQSIPDSPLQPHPQGRPEAPAAPTSYRRRVRMLRDEAAATMRREEMGFVTREGGPLTTSVAGAGAVRGRGKMPRRIISLDGDDEDGGGGARGGITIRGVGWRETSTSAEAGAFPSSSSSAPVVSAMYLLTSTGSMGRGIGGGRQNKPPRVPKASKEAKKKSSKTGPGGNPSSGGPSSARHGRSSSFAGFAAEPPRYEAAVMMRVARVTLDAGGFEFESEGEGEGGSVLTYQQKLMTRLTPDGSPGQLLGSSAGSQRQGGAHATGQVSPGGRGGGSDGGGGWDSGDDTTDSSDTDGPGGSYLFSPLPPLPTAAREVHVMNRHRDSTGVAASNNNGGGSEGGDGTRAGLNDGLSATPFGCPTLAAGGGIPTAARALFLTESAPSSPSQPQSMKEWSMMAAVAEEARVAPLLPLPLLSPPPLSRQLPLSTPPESDRHSTAHVPGYELANVFRQKIAHNALAENFLGAFSCSRVVTGHGSGGGGVGGAEQAEGTVEEDAIVVLSDMRFYICRADIGLAALWSCPLVNLGTMILGAGQQLVCLVPTPAHSGPAPSGPGGFITGFPGSQLLPAILLMRCSASTLALVSALSEADPTLMADVSIDGAAAAQLECVRRQLLPRPAEALVGFGGGKSKNRKSNRNSRGNNRNKNQNVQGKFAPEALDLRMYVMVWHRCDGGGASRKGSGVGLMPRTLVLTAEDIILATEAVARFHTTFANTDTSTAATSSSASTSSNNPSQTGGYGYYHCEHRAAADAIAAVTVGWDDPDRAAAAMEAAETGALFGGEGFGEAGVRVRARALATPPVACVTVSFKQSGGAGGGRAQSGADIITTASKTGEKVGKHKGGKKGTGADESARLLGGSGEQPWELIMSASEAVRFQTLVGSWLEAAHV
jgi:hypothetical protein